MKTSSLSCLFGALALAALSGCEDAPDPGSRVASLRVLAQEMDAPYAAPGETVHIRSLVHDPEGREIEWAWAMCVNPSTTQVEGCLAKLAADGGNPVLAQGVGLDSLDVTVPLDALDSLPEPTRPNASVGVLSAACPGTLSFDSTATPLPLRCTETGTGRELGLDEFVVGVKRIVVRNQDRNANPAIVRITLDGAEWTEDQLPEFEGCDHDGNDFSACADSVQHKLSVELGPDSTETGTTEFGQEFQEELVLQYFATEGNFENDSRIAKSPGNKWAPRRQAAGRDITFWFVARDNRGGVSWVSRRAHVK